MQLEITGQNIEITDALRDYISEKFERIQRHFGNLTGGHFVLKIERLEHTAEGTIQVAGRTNAVHADAMAEDMYAAIDILMDKLDRQVRRHKSRITDHHRNA